MTPDHATPESCEVSMMRYYTITTLLAALFNVLVLIVICWGLMPQLAREAATNRGLMLECRDLLLDIRDRSQRIDQEMKVAADRAKGIRKMELEK